MNRSEDKFSNHIRSVFEEFDTEGADYGWVELRKSFPAKNNKKPLYLWLSGVAAALLVIGFLILNTHDSRSPLPRPVNLTKNKSLIPKYTDSSLTDAKSSLPKYAKTSDLLIHSKKETSLYPLKQTAVSALNTNSADSVVITVSDIKKDFRVSTNKTDTTKASKLTILDFFEKESKQNVKTNKVLASASKKTNKDQKNLLFDIYTATYLNYYADNPVKVNAGAGFSADLRVSNTVFFSFGAGISQNKMTYQNTKPSSMASVASDLASVVLQNGFIAPKEASKLEAQFVTIDIPIALKFYMEEKSRFFFSAGLNSSTYINQRYSGSVNAYDPKGNSFSDLQGKTEELKFKGFDFGNSAILAIGMDQSIGKNSTLTFEPFFKPSLTGYGERKIKINTVGLNLKLSLGGKK